MLYRLRTSLLARCVAVGMLALTACAAPANIAPNTVAPEASPPAAATGVLAVAPAAFDWRESPAVAQVQSAAVIGQLSKAGLYASMGTIGEGVVFPVHAHPDARITTVISGVMYYGVGTSFDLARVQPYPAGSVLFTPAGVPHVMWAKDGDIVVQEAGFGPSGLAWADALDEPLPALQYEAVRPAEAVWQADPAVAGVQSMLVAGNPQEAGLYAAVGEMQAGTVFPAHVHADDRVTTVLSGEMYYAAGESLDADAMIGYPAGSVIFTPAGVPHVMWAKDGDIVVQETGFGPSETTFVAAALAR